MSQADIRSARCVLCELCESEDRHAYGRADTRSLAAVCASLRTDTPTVKADTRSLAAVAACCASLRTDTPTVRRQLGCVFASLR